MRRAVSALLVLVLLPALWGVVADRKPPIDHRRAGNAELLAQIEPLLSGHGPMSVAVVRADSVSYAFVGTDRSAQFEAGSLTKLLTAQLLSDAIERGEVAINDRLGDLIDVAGPVADVTLGELVTHRSGLDEWGGAESIWQRLVRSVFAGNPYDFSRGEMLKRAENDSLRFRGEYHYSNLGFALLGDALAEVAGTDYSTLLARRILDPTAMSDSVLGHDTDLNQSRGFTASGRRSAPWNLGAFAPSGGLRTTIDDMTRWARSALSSNSTAGRSTSQRYADAPYGWQLDDDGITLVKTGMTGGFASVIVLDPRAGVAVVILSAAAVPVEEIAATVLEDER